MKAAVAGALQLRVEENSLAQQQLDVMATVLEVSVSGPPGDALEAYSRLFTPEAIKFLVDLVTEHQESIDALYQYRLQRRTKYIDTLPKFETSEVRQGDWTVADIDERLRSRRVLLGDVSPSETDRFVKALNAPVDGIQVDFDDGHCPTWRNQILGLYNIYRATRGLLTPDKYPRGLVFRPRAWNMLETNIMVNGKQVPGALVDFGLVYFHNAKLLLDQGLSPCFQLSKIEAANEARLWNQIFAWSEQRLGLAEASTKASVLVENVLAVFQAEEILYQLRQRCLGLVCGVWDYCASIISKFGARPEFLIPPRQKYVNLGKRFLRNYMRHVVQVCRRRGAMVIGGMAVQVFDSDSDSDCDIDGVLLEVYTSKLEELGLGVDCVLVYDIQVASNLAELLRKHPTVSQVLNQSEVRAEDLLNVPKGMVVMSDVEQNVTVALLYILHWLCGKGCFIHGSKVEDSATAEISRWQLWQWIRLRVQVVIPERNIERTVSKNLLEEICPMVVGKLSHSSEHWLTEERIRIGRNLLLDLVTRRDAPEFLTTYLDEQLIIRHAQEERSSDN